MGDQSPPLCGLVDYLLGIVRSNLWKITFWLLVLLIVDNLLRYDGLLHIMRARACRVVARTMIG